MGRRERLRGADHQPQGITVGRTVRYSFAEISLELFCGRYQHQAKYLEFCRQCQSYGKCWACPPLSFDTEEYLSPYRYVTVVASQVFFDAEERKSGYSAERLKEITWSTLSRQKKIMFDRLMACERAVSGSLQLASGGCHLCPRCARADGCPCRCPEQLRYSLDAFGFDLTAITEDLMGIRLLWCRDALPEYYTLVHALLSPVPAIERVKHSFRDLQDEE